MAENIKGVEELLDKLNSLEVNALAELRKAVDREIKKTVQAEAKLMCPADDGALRNSIVTQVTEDDNGIEAKCVTSKEYAAYVEFGTGPKGQADNAGISPEASIAYSQTPWWIHEGSGKNEVDRETAEKYGWFYVDTPNGRFYKCYGQAAQPFMYPALKNNEKQIKARIKKDLKDTIGRLCEK